MRSGRDLKGRIGATHAKHAPQTTRAVEANASLARGKSPRMSIMSLEWSARVWARWARLMEQSTDTTLVPVEGARSATREFCWIQLVRRRMLRSVDYCMDSPYEKTRGRRNEIQVQ